MGIRQKLARWLNERGNAAPDGRSDGFYKLTAHLDPHWAAPWYNLGLTAKRERRWRDSLRFNQRAIRLDPKHEAALWNLGIAATALSEWEEARNAWLAYGIKLRNAEGEVSMEPVRGCCRIDPEGAGEVVWGSRIDPARMIILNVPLPESKHRFRDIVLHDGAPSGTREVEGVEYPVFDELAIWQASDYSTFQAHIEVPGDDSEEMLIGLCDEQQLGIEDWSSIRIICKQCSLGTVHSHSETSEEPGDSLRCFGFAARNRSQLEQVLASWVERSMGASLGGLKVVLEP